MANATGQSIRKSCNKNKRACATYLFLTAYMMTPAIETEPVLRMIDFLCDSTVWRLIRSVYAICFVVFSMHNRIITCFSLLVSLAGLVCWLGTCLPSGFASPFCFDGIVEGFDINKTYFDKKYCAGGEDYLYMLAGILK